MAEVFGIDLGTSSCSVATMIDGHPQVLPVFDGQYEMPTYVAFTSDGQRLIGWPAKRQSVTNPANTIFTIKRLIGRKFVSDATQAELGLLPYRVIPAATGGLWVEARGRNYTPTEITAMMLGEVKRATEAYLDHKLNQAVITVPAYFDEGQRRATKDAAEIAGIEALRLIAEPTAAAIAFGFGVNRRGTIAVYDLGGGTFDISVLDIGDGVFEVKAVSGDNRLGGEDFDHRLVRYFIDQLQRTHDLNLVDDPLALHRIKDAAEQLKIQLDVVHNATINLPYLSAIKGNFFHAELRLTRDLLESLFCELIERTLNPCRLALKDAGLKPDDIDALLLVGGMSRTPDIRRKVAEFFNLKPEGHADPTRSVAHGAAIQAAVLKGNIKDVLLYRRNPYVAWLCGSAGCLC
jgi:molecular chaperone DnaK